MIDPNLVGRVLELSEQLNRDSNTLNECIEELQTTLQANTGGAQVWVTLPDSGVQLGFTTNKGFQIRTPNAPTEWRSLLSCSRELRCEAVLKFDDLLRALIEQIEDTYAVVRRALNAALTVREQTEKASQGTAAETARR